MVAKRIDTTSTSVARALRAIGLVEHEARSRCRMWPWFRGRAGLDPHEEALDEAARCAGRRDVRELGRRCHFLEPEENDSSERQTSLMDDFGTMELDCPAVSRGARIGSRVSRSVIGFCGFSKRRPQNHSEHMVEHTAYRPISNRSTAPFLPLSCPFCPFQHVPGSPPGLSLPLDDPLLFESSQVLRCLALRRQFECLMDDYNEKIYPHRFTGCHPCWRDLRRSGC